jgi:hypothetical protein
MSSIKSVQNRITVLTLFFLNLIFLTPGVHSFTNKTFLSDNYRPFSAVEKASLWLFDTDNTSPIIHNFDATAFYAESTNKKSIGKYFGVNDSNTILFGRGSVQNDAPRGDVFYGSIILRGDDDLGQQRATLTLKPSQQVMGAQFSYAINLQKYFPGLTAGVSFDISEVEHHMNTKFIPNVAALTNATDDPQEIFTLLKGEMSDAGKGMLFADHEIEQLTHAKLKKKQKVSGIADIHAFFGYKAKPFEEGDVALGIKGTLPTGNEAKGEFLFEPIYGNGKHLSLGYFVHSDWVAWSDNNQSVKLAAFLDYEYLFSNKEVRTLGLKSGGNYSHYYLLGKKGTIESDKEKNESTPVIPAANVLTMKVNVRPGSQLEMGLSGRYITKEWMVQLGYKLAACEEERVVRSESWQEETYAIANESYSTNGLFIADNDQVASGREHDWITAKDLDVSTATTPAKLSHTAFLHTQGEFLLKNDIYFKLHGKFLYQFPAKNSSIERWGAEFGVGVSF